MKNRLGSILAGTIFKWERFQEECIFMTLEEHSPNVLEQNLLKIRCLILFGDLFSKGPGEIVYLSGIIKIAKEIW